MDQQTNSKKKPVIITAIIAVVLLTIGVAAYFYLSGPRAPQRIDDPNRVADLTFQFDQITAAPGEQLELDVFLQSDISVTQADITLAYDSNAIIIEDIQPTVDNFMGTPTEYEIVEDTIDNEEGLAVFRISALDTPEPPSKTRQGRGIIARLRIVVHPTFSGTAPLIIFKDEEVPNLTSRVFKENSPDSILDNAGSISILVQ